MERTAAYVNRGLGNLRGVRFYCRPQITAIDVKSVG